MFSNQRHLGTRLFWAQLDEKWPNQCAGGHQPTTPGTGLFWAGLEEKWPKWSVKVVTNQHQLGTRLFWAQLEVAKTV